MHSVYPRTSRGSALPIVFTTRTRPTTEPGAMHMGEFATEPSFSRRGLLRVAVATSAGAMTFSPGEAPSSIYSSAPQTALSFRLRETAGLRRFGYPVHTVVVGAATD